MVAGVCSADGRRAQTGLTGHGEAVGADAGRRDGQPGEGLEVKTHLANVVRHLKQKI